MGFLSLFSQIRFYSQGSSPLLEALSLPTPLWDTSSLICVLWKYTSYPAKKKKKIFSLTKTNPRTPPLLLTVKSYTGHCDYDKAGKCCLICTFHGPYPITDNSISPNYTYLKRFNEKIPKRNEGTVRRGRRPMNDDESTLKCPLPIHMRKHIVHFKLLYKYREEDES